MAEEKDPIKKDQDPSVPGNIADSPNRGGEEVAKEEQEPGRKDAGTQGASNRPVGKSDTRDMTGVDPQKIITRDEDNPAG
jgi:hypothetical protein